MTDPRLAHLRCIVLEGGGARGGAYPAALDTLEPHLPLHLRGWRVPVAAGTSAGAIAALAIAVRLPLRWALDGIPWGSIAPRFGAWGRTDKLRACLVEMLRAAHVPGEITLADLPARTGCTLYVAVRDESWSQQRTLLLGPEMLGELPVVDAVRASAALPVVFRPVRLGKLALSDGGVAANYPFSLVLRRHGLLPEEMLGFRVDDPDEVAGGHYVPPARLPWKALSRLVLGLADEQNAHVPAEIWARTVRAVVPKAEVRARDFALTAEQRAVLDRAGRAGAEGWLGL